MQSELPTRLVLCLRAGAAGASTSVAQRVNLPILRQPAKFLVPLQVRVPPLGAGSSVGSLAMAVGVITLQPVSPLLQVSQLVATAAASAVLATVRVRVKCSLNAAIANHHTASRSAAIVNLLTASPAAPMVAASGVVEVAAVASAEVVGAAAAGVVARRPLLAYYYLPLDFSRAGLRGRLFFAHTFFL